MNKIIFALFLLTVSVNCFSQTYTIDSTQAKKSIQIKAERDSLRIVVKYFEFDNAMQDTIIQAQSTKIANKDRELRLVYDMKNILQERVNFLEKQPKEIKQENKYSFLEIAGYTFLIVLISFVSGVLAF